MSSDTNPPTSAARFDPGLDEGRGTALRLLDVRVSRAIPFDRVGRIEVLVDVLNALNDAAEEGLATDDLFSPNFGQATSFTDPRRVMMGVRVNLGR